MTSGFLQLESTVGIYIIQDVSAKTFEPNISVICQRIF
jgi:hypothetical protein